MLRPSLLALASCLVGACTGAAAPEPPPALTTRCTRAQDVAPAVGAVTFVDATADSGCIRLPAASGTPARYLVAALSGTGIVLPNGVQTAARLQVDGTGTSTTARLGLEVDAPVAASAAERFHDLLRERDARAAARHQGQPGLRQLQRAATVPPTPGSTRTFNVCGNLTCSSFVPVTASAQIVGRRVAIYVDNAAPAGGFSRSELEGLGRLYDDWIYPIDTTAFGRESDLDGNGVVIALITPAVNRIIPDCNASQSRVLGYFTGADLVPGEPGSNGGEIFYALAPDPGNPTCTVTTAFARQQVPVVFMHEFQHMISFAEHVLRRNGRPEQGWLNEGLSHLAEELGARGIPDTAGGITTDRFTQFVFNNVANAYAYLRAPDAAWLVTPATSPGSSADRGANWLFVRWLLDQQSAGTPPLSRQLVQTALIGEENVQGGTGVPFATLVLQWQLANALDDLPELPVGTDARLQYRSWNWRRTFAEQRQNDPGRFPLAYPLVPDSVRTAAVDRNFTLRAGSGRFLVVDQAPGGAARAIRFGRPDGSALPDLHAPRVAVYRLR